MVNCGNFLAIMVQSPLLVLIDWIGLLYLCQRYMLEEYAKEAARKDGLEYTPTAAAAVVVAVSDDVIASLPLTATFSEAAAAPPPPPPPYKKRKGETKAQKTANKKKQQEMQFPSGT
jgi:hypothetical protein